MSKPYKQRFKGVENFLRRVAFNLGNTPSQTEVKIISCIPIDVTDLQHKIQLLERQVQELSKRKDAPSPPSPEAAPKPSPPPEPERTEKPEKPPENAAAAAKNVKIGDKASTPANEGATVVNTALFGEFLSGQTTVAYSSDGSIRDNRSRNRPTNNGCCTTRHRKSNVSFVLPEMSTSCTHESSYDFSSRDNVDPDKIENDDLDKIDTNLAAAERYYMSLFKKRRKKRICKGKSKVKTHLVYFAQHDQRSPFNTNNTFDNFDTLNTNAVSVSHAYLGNVIRKQYDPKFVVQEFSDTSHFSRPICRDTKENFTHSRLYESDVCSCCYGQFQNIDDYMPKGFESINRMTKYERNFTNKPYYDSNFYDIVPVRENKFLKESVLPKRDIEIRCWPEQFRSKYRYAPKTVSHQSERLPKRREKLTVQKIKHKERSEQYNTEQTRIKVQETIKESSEMSFIKGGDHRNTSSKINKIEPMKTVLLKNELTETDDTNNKLLVNNQSTQLELIPNDDKTESTLNQIKSILQSVLTEVKTNPKVSSTLAKAPLKDAVVQKGTSQNNMLGQSTLLNSFTYNHSYNANPYLPSCSRQALVGQNCVASAPYQNSLKCLQNFPVFVYPSGRPLCACYCKKSSHKCSKCKRASTAATNTDREIQRNGNKETEKLVKEIYKSMALSMDFPTKENSVSDYDDLKSAENDHMSEKNVKNLRSACVLALEVKNKRDIEVEALISSNISTQSEEKARTIEARHYDQSTKNQENHDRILDRLEQHSTETILENDEDSDAGGGDAENTEGDDVDTTEYEMPAKRKSLLQRMLGSVKMFKKKKIESIKQNDYKEEVSEESDTEDYETIYSGVTVVLPPKSRRQNHGRKTEMKSNTAAQSQFMRLQEKGRRSPYLEQEYRRQWHEQMMFAKQQEKKYSSERPFSKSTPTNDNTPVYWNNYEARSAIVEHNLPNRPKCVDSKMTLSTKLKRDSLGNINDGGAKDKLQWMKKCRPACGEQWKKFLLEN